LRRVCRLLASLPTYLLTYLPAYLLPSSPLPCLSSPLCIHSAFLSSIACHIALTLDSPHLRQETPHRPSSPNPILALFLGISSPCLFSSRSFTPRNPEYPYHSLSFPRESAILHLLCDHTHHPGKAYDKAVLDTIV